MSKFLDYIILGKFDDGNDHTTFDGTETAYVHPTPADSKVYPLILLEELRDGNSWEPGVRRFLVYISEYIVKALRRIDTTLNAGGYL